MLEERQCHRHLWRVKVARSLLLEGSIADTDQPPQNRHCLRCWRGVPVGNSVMRENTTTRRCKMQNSSPVRLFVRINPPPVLHKQECKFFEWGRKSDNPISAVYNCIRGLHCQICININETIIKYKLIKWNSDKAKHLRAPCNSSVQDWCYGVSSWRLRGWAVMEQLPEPRAFSSWTHGRSRKIRVAQRS